MSLEIDRPLCASELARAWGKTPATILYWIENGTGRGKKYRRLKAMRLGGRWCITPEIAREFLAPDAPPAQEKARVTRPDPDRRRRVLALLGKA